MENQGYIVHKPGKGPTDKEIRRLLDLRRDAIYWFHRALERPGTPVIDDLLA